MPPAPFDAQAEEVPDAASEEASLLRSEVERTGEAQQPVTADTAPAPEQPLTPFGSLRPEGSGLPEPAQPRRLPTGPTIPPSAGLVLLREIAACRSNGAGGLSGGMEAALIMRCMSATLQRASSR